MTINAPNDIVNHYGDVSKVDIQKIDMNCYNEYGNATYVKVTEGKVVAKDGGKIDVVFANNTDQTKIAVINENGSIESGYTIVANTTNQDRDGGIQLTCVTAVLVDAIQDATIKIDMIENSGLYEARIGTKGYETFEGAVGAIKSGETLVLCKDIVRNKDCDVWNTKAFNIDLNTYTYETQNEKNNDTYKDGAFCFSGNYNITIKNGTIKTRYGAPIYTAKPTITLENVNLNQDHNNYVQHIKEFSSAIRITGGGKVIVNSGTFEGYYALDIAGGGEFVINGGTFTNPLIFNSNISDSTKAKFEINGGIFNNFSVINPTKGTVTINGGSFTVSEENVDTVKGFVATGKTVTINGTEYTGE